MKTLLRSLAVLALLCTSACVRSLYPFCPDSAKAPRPDLDGTWHSTTAGGEVDKAARLVFSGGRITTTNDEEHTGGALEVAYFQAGGQWFADTSPARLEPDCGPDGWWLMHNVPAHLVSRVEVDGDRLKLTPLDQDWLKSAIRATNSPAKNIRIDLDDQQLFAARPAAWLELLGRVATDTNAFPAGRTIVLRKSP